MKDVRATAAPSSTCSKVPATPAVPGSPAWCRASAVRGHETALALRDYCRYLIALAFQPNRQQSEARTWSRSWRVLPKPKDGCPPKAPALQPGDPARSKGTGRQWRPARSCRCGGSQLSVRGSGLPRRSHAERVARRASSQPRRELPRLRTYSSRREPSTSSKDLPGCRL